MISIIEKRNLGYNRYEETPTLKVFYKAIKDATMDNINRIFMTGVSPIMLDDLTSGFNITRNYTLDENLNGMMGFAKEELLSVIDEVSITDVYLKIRFVKI